MPRYLISFNDGDMTFAPQDLPQVAEDAHVVLREAKAAGVWVFGGGFMGYVSTVVDTEGAVRPGPLAATDVYIGGMSIIDVPTLDVAHEWAAKFARACRCAQEVREFMDDPESV